MLLWWIISHRSLEPKAKGKENSQVHNMKRTTAFWIIKRSRTKFIDLSVDYFVRVQIITLSKHKDDTAEQIQKTNNGSTILIAAYRLPLTTCRLPLAAYRLDSIENYLRNYSRRFIFGSTWCRRKNEHS